MRDASAGLAKLVGSGTSVLEALRTLAGTADRRTSALLLAMAADVDAGQALSDAMASHPMTWRPADVHVARAGERIGHLGEAFRTIGDRMERASRLRRRLLAGMVYPMLVLGSSIVILPLPELIVGSASSYVWQVFGNLFTAAVLIGGALFGLPRLLRLPAVRGNATRLAWRLPWPGTLYVLHVREVFCRTLSHNVHAGLSIHESLQSAADVTADPVVGAHIAGVLQSIDEGTDLTEPLGASGLVPAGDLMLVASGEKSGTLVESLDALANRYADRLEAGLKTALTVANTLFTVVIMIYVGAQVLEAQKAALSDLDEVMEMIENL